MDIPLNLSGNFAELRNNHFHAGIDIKTKTKIIVDKYNNLLLFSRKILNNIITRIKQAFNDLKRLGEGMMSGLLKFFGLEVRNIKINGGGDFPLI